VRHLRRRDSTTYSPHPFDIPRRTRRGFVLPAHRASGTAPRA